MEYLHFWCNFIFPTTIPQAQASNTTYVLVLAKFVTKTYNTSIIDVPVAPALLYLWDLFFYLRTFFATKFNRSAQSSAHVEHDPAT